MANISFFEHLKNAQDGIKAVGELVKLVEENKALWIDDFGVTVQLTNTEAKTAILARLKDHFDTLQPDTSQFVKEEYWLGSHGHEVVFGQSGAYLDEYGEVAVSGRGDLLFSYYLIAKDKNKIDAQIDEILRVIIERELDPLNIPKGEKQEIEKVCKLIKPLFSPSSFTRAWKKASKIELISITDKIKHLKNR